MFNHIFDRFKFLVNNEDGYVHGIVVMVLLLSVLYLGITFYEPLSKNTDVAYICDYLVREIEETGEINSEVYNMSSNLSSELGMSPSIQYDGNFIYTSRGTRAIQLREPFYVTVSLPIQIKVFDPMFTEAIYFDFNISKRLKGVGQVYWRESEL